MPLAFGLQQLVRGGGSCDLWVLVCSFFMHSLIFFRLWFLVCTGEAGFPCRLSICASLHQASSPGVRITARPQQQGGTVFVPWHAPQLWEQATSRRWCLPCWNAGDLMFLPLLVYVFFLFFFLPFLSPSSFFFLSLSSPSSLFSLFVFSLFFFSQPCCVKCHEPSKYLSAVPK